jgi:hypothetical protein
MSVYGKLIIQQQQQQQHKNISFFAKPVCLAVSLLLTGRLFKKALSVFEIPIWNIRTTENRCVCLCM